MSDEPSDPVFFVWLQGVRGPEPKLWFKDRPASLSPVTVLFKQQLGEADRGETFETLQLKYPAPAPAPDLTTKLDRMNTARDSADERAVTEPTGAERQAPERPERSEGANGGQATS